MQVFRVISVLLLSVLSAKCQRYTTDELLNSNFGSEDLTPVTLLSPINNSASTKQPDFVWTKRRGARQYRLQVSSLADFSVVVLDQTTTDTSYKFLANDLIGISQLDAVGYYWRITTIYATQQVVSSTNLLLVLDDSVMYVDANSAMSTQVGNRTSPYKTIQAGIESAHLLRNEVATTAMTIAVAQGTYNEAVTLRPGISVMGGYEATNWTRNILTNSTTIRGVVDSAISGDGVAVTATTVIDGFTIYAGNAPNNYGIYLSAGASPTITNNKIYGGQGNFSSGIIYNGPANPTIRNNTIYGGSGGANGSYGIYVTGGTGSISMNTIYGGTGVASVGIHVRNSSAPFIFNNIILAGSGPSSRGIDNYISTNPVITNNVIFGGCGSRSGTVYSQGAHGIYSWASSTPVVTNNIIFVSGIERYGYREADANGEARSLENNAFWDVDNSSSFNLYYNENPTPPAVSVTTIIGMESLTDWPGGADKARGNLLLPAGSAGNPFVNVPIFWERTTTSNTSSTSVLLIRDGSCPKYTDGQYIEWNGDGVARQISCNGATNPDELTISPVLADSTKNIASAEIRYWGNKSSGGTQYTLDFHLQQNALALQDWNNLRYGGKDTSGNNCGGAASTGPGSQNCGAVTTDFEGVTRTILNSGLANNNSIPNGSVGATAAVPGGYSIGAYEKD